jgi:hypothetical protein
MRGLNFFIILVIITAVDLLVPYYLIGDIASLAASYLFWTALTFLVILFALIYTGYWGRRS